MSAKNISIIPNPQQVTESPGWFELKPDTVIKVPRALAEIGKHLQDYLVLETGFTLEIKDAEGNNESKNEIFLSTDGV